MNLMYFKNLRGDRDGGSTGLLSGGRRTTSSAFSDGGGGGYGGASSTGYGGYGPGIMRGMGGGNPGVGASGSNIGGGGGGSGSRWGFTGGGARSAASSSGGTSSHLATVGAQPQVPVNVASVSSSGAGAGGGAIIIGGVGGGGTNQANAINISNGSSNGSSSNDTPSAMQGQQHLRTHPLGLFDLPRHQSSGEQSGSGGGGGGGGGVDHHGRYDDDHHQQRGGGVRGNSGIVQQQRWSHQQYVERGDTRADYRYTRVDRQHMPTPASSSANRGGGGGGHHHAGSYSSQQQQQQQDQLLPNDVSTAAVSTAAGSRSVRSGLYDTEVCLSVSGLGNVRGTMASSSTSGAGGGGGGGSGRSGKQVSFGRYSPDVQQMMMMNSGGGSGGGGTIERERSRDSDSMLTVGLRPSANDKRSSRSSGSSAMMMAATAAMNNKENSNGELMTGAVVGGGGGGAVRSTFPRSSIVASKRSSPERLLAADSSGRGGGGQRRDDSADSSRSHRSRRSGVVGRDGTAETSLTLSLPDPISRHQQQQRGGGGGRRGGGADNNRTGSVYHDPIFDDLIDPKDLNLNEIPRDCFIIPVHLVNRFLPLGVTLPQTGRASMSVVEVDEPQLVILLHFMTPFMAIQPVFESPLARPASLQGQLASQLLVDLLRDRPGSHGMLLVSIEQDVDYPYINYGIASRQQTNGEDWQQTARLASLERFDPQNLRYFSDHLVDVYEEAATIARPPLQPHCRRPLSNKTGYIVCVYKVFEGDDGEKFERNWLYWTGARILYQCVPRNVGLRRITLHKTVSAGDKLYTLMCECSSFMDHLQEAAYIAPALRARLCGYWSIYRVAEVY